MPPAGRRTSARSILWTQGAGSIIEKTRDLPVFPDVGGLDPSGKGLGEPLWTRPLPWRTAGAVVTYGGETQAARMTSSSRLRGGVPLGAGGSTPLTLRLRRSAEMQQMNGPAG